MENAWSHELTRNFSYRYGFRLVSDCVKRNPHDVKRERPRECKDSSKPVRCPDGQCQPDYISCLKSMSSGWLKLGTAEDRAANAERKKEEEILKMFHDAEFELGGK